MLMCCECGGKFDESDAKMVQEQVGEYMGRPAYELGYTVRTVTARRRL